MPQTNLGTMFKLLSIAFEPPTVSWSEAIVSGALRDEIKAAWEALGLSQQAIDVFYKDLETYVERDDETVLHELRREFTRLFLGDKPLVTNSEGLWRLRSEGRDGVLIVNSYSLEVAEFMRQCGVVKAEGYNDCIDYIETECDFAAFLAGGPEYLIELGKDPIALLELFMDEHMTLWIPGFCADVLRASGVVYYKALCALMGEFTKEF